MTRDQEVHVPAFKVNAVILVALVTHLLVAFPIIMFKG